MCFKWVSRVAWAHLTVAAACRAAPIEDAQEQPPTVEAQPAPQALAEPAAREVARTGKQQPVGDQAGCSHKHPRACYEAALHLQGPNKVQRAVPLFEAACDGKVAPACYALGRILEKGAGVRAEPTRGRELVERACREGYQAACDALGH